MQKANIFVQQQQKRNNAQHMTFLNFCCMFEAGSFDEEVMSDERFVGLCRDENGMLQVHAEFVYDVASYEQRVSNSVACKCDEEEQMGKGWVL